MLKKLIDYAKELGFEAFQISENNTKTHELERVDNKIAKNVVSKTGSLSLKGIINGKAVYAGTENDKPEDIKKVIDQMLENSKTITIDEPELIYPGDKKYEKLPKRDFDFSKVNPNEKFKLLEDMEKEASKAPHLQRVAGCYYTDVKSSSRMVNSYGLDLSDEVSYSSIGPYIVLRNGDDVVSSYEPGFGFDFKSLKPVEVAKEAVRKGVEKLGAVTSVKQGPTTIMFSPEAMSLLLYVFSGIFKSSTRFAKQTKLVDKLDKKIASELITIINNPLEKSAIMQSSFDNEGVATKKTVVVEKGVFKKFLNNLKYAKMYNEEPTGSGSGIGVNNFYIEKGKTKLEDGYKLVGNGLYINSFAGLHAGVDSVSGKFSLQSSGFLIENGKKTKPVKMIVLSGNFYELLNNVIAVCDDFEFRVSPLISITSPSVVVKNIVVASETKE